MATSIPHLEFSDAEADLHTEEDRGTSFRQLLCIAFDLAILTLDDSGNGGRLFKLGRF